MDALPHHLQNSLLFPCDRSSRPSDTMDCIDLVDLHQRMSVQGQTRKCRCLHGTSVVPSRADVARTPRQVRFVPFAIFCTAEYSTLFNRKVGDGTAVLVRVQSPRCRQVRRSTLPRRSSIMDIDRDHTTMLFLLYYFSGVTTECATWKSFDWAAMERLHTAKLNPSYSLTKACVSPKHYSENCSQSDAK